MGEGGGWRIGLPQSVVQCFLAFAIMVLSAQSMLVNNVADGHL